MRLKMKVLRYRAELLFGLALLLIVGAVAIPLGQMKSEGYLRKRVVRLTSKEGMCSGEQVRAKSGVDYILTAGHCANLAVDGAFTVTTEDGHTLSRRVIAEDPTSDLLLVEGLPGLKGLDISKSAQFHDHVRTFTHGKNMATYRTDGELIQDSKVSAILSVITTPEEEKKCNLPKHQVLEVDLIFFHVKACILTVEEWATTAMIVPGSSGGMVVDDNGDLVGVCSASGEGFGFVVKLNDIQRFLAGY